METFSTLHCAEKVTDRVFTTQKLDTKEVPFKYVVKDLEGKLLAHLIFKGKENDGISDKDLLEIIIDRLRCQQEESGKRERGFALARAEESLLWLNK